MKRPRILSVLMFTLILSTLIQRPMVTNTLYEGEAITYKKSEVVEVKFSPFGELLSEVAKVTLEVYNNDSSPVSVNIVDRVKDVQRDSLIMLYDTPNPARVEDFGNLTLINWENVMIDPHSRLKFQYMAKTWRTIPVTVSETIYVNGKQVDPKFTREIYSLDASVSDSLTIQFTIQNTGQPLYTFNDTASPIFMCTVVALLPDYYFSDIRTVPEANSTSTIADQTLITWILFLKDSATLRISSQIEAVNSWGAAPIETITIQLEPVPEKIAEEAESQAESMSVYTEKLDGVADILDNLSSMLDQVPPSSSNYTETLQATGTTLKELSTALTEVLPLIENPATKSVIENIRDQFSELGDRFLSAASGVGEAEELIEELHTTTEELQGQIGTLRDQKKKLDELSLLIRNQKTPNNVEVFSSDATKNYEVEIIVEERVQQNSSLWAIESIRFTNRGEGVEVINGLSLQTIVNQLSVKPKYVRVQVNEVWQDFNGDLAQLGLTYDMLDNAVYLWPRVKVEASESKNILTDWAGRPVTFVYESSEEPQFSYTLDVEEQFPEAQIDPIKSRTMNIINQPYIFAGDLTLPDIEPPPPPPSEGTDWIQVLNEFLQSQIVHIFFFSSFIILGFLYVKISKEKASEKMTIIQREEARRVIREIDQAIQTIKEKDSS